MVIRRNRKHYYLYIKSRGLAGIYIHIPFCRKACHYCNFHFSTNLTYIDDMVAALNNEIELQKDFLGASPKTVYFGGGTPSILSTVQLESILDKLEANIATNELSEITLEVNPEDVSPEKASGWQALGINRISLGIQTFNDTVLKSLNRVHTGRQAVEAIETLQAAGLSNITADLIYGLPEQPFADWRDNLEKIIELKIPHISAYALTIEGKTFFGHQQNKGLLQVPSEESYEEQYWHMCEVLRHSGYEHYEVSNFAQPQNRSQHNQLYWQGAPYLGIGPGAHSFNGHERRFNVSNNPAYLKSLIKGIVPCETEVLNAEQAYNEYLLTRLRTNAGIDLKNIHQQYKIDLATKKQTYFRQCIDNKLAYFDGDNFVLTEKGFFVSDAIILELMK